MSCQIRVLLQNTMSHETLFQHGLKTNRTASLEKRNSSRKNTRCWNFEKVDKAKYTTGLSEKEAKKYL